MDKYAIRALLQRIASEQAAQEMGLDVQPSSNPQRSQVREGLTSQHLAAASQDAFDSEDPEGFLGSMLDTPDTAMRDQQDLQTGLSQGIDIQQLMNMLRMRGQR